ncbi:hypothetical protein Spa11_39320 [Botrimarina mediterranea]|uniref:Uncharacterized protein n=1 Tax=Botrimarina mediterranea TaxID=2528022 RepID=A0A518KD34_9BACT|nr:hypothetical protein Spa11_39320 [Botrimarina mediterranea]
MLIGESKQKNFNYTYHLTLTFPRSMGHVR